MMTGGDCLNPAAMDNEYYSFEAIIAEGQVSSMAMYDVLSLRA
jgi:hypothetical protein